MQEFLTACPRNCYSTCSFKVQIENNSIKRILPYRGNLATPEGPCIKGLSYIERINSPARIIHPLIRLRDGTFQQITSGEALEIIAEKLYGIRQKYGSRSVLWYKGSGMSGLTNEIGTSFWRSFGGTTTTYGNLCWPAGLEAIRLTLGSVKHNVPWDLENAKLVIIWGKNPAETNIQEMAFIARAKERGALLIVIDPMRTPTADKADILYSPLPGTDGALALAIAGILIRESLIDRSFIEKHVKGFEEFSASLNISSREAEKITGIPANNIIELAHYIGQEKPVTILPGYGLQRHYNGGQTIRAILSLIAITGNIGKSGAGFNYANLQSYIYDDPKEPLSYYPDPENDNPFRRIISMARLGNDILNATNPEIRAAWIERGNPVLQAPDTNLVIRALSRLEFRVVVEQFMTDTAQIADLILPAKDMFGQSDILGSYWSPYIQYKPKILEQPGEVMPESEIYYHLDKLLKLGNDSNSIPEPGDNNIEEWLRKRISHKPDLSLDDLKLGPVLVPGLREVAWDDLKFDTPSGKIELISDQASRIWGVDSLPGYSAPVSGENANEFPLVFITPNTGSRIHSQFGNLDIIRKTVENPAAVAISPGDASARNIRTGDKIRVYNSIGEIHSVARILNRIPPGCVMLPNGIWFNEGGGGNRLVSAVETDMGFGAAFHDTRVEVEKTV